MCCHLISPPPPFLWVIGRLYLSKSLVLNYSVIKQQKLMKSARFVISQLFEANFLWHSGSNSLLFADCVFIALYWHMVCWPAILYNLCGTIYSLLGQRRGQKYFSHCYENKLYSSILKLLGEKEPYS